MSSFFAADCAVIPGSRQPYRVAAQEAPYLYANSRDFIRIATSHRTALMDKQPPGPTPSGSTRASPENRLDSWKEIAAFLRREVRTVQRWEKTAGLPVHRLRIERQSAVYAYKSELNAWYANRKLQLDSDSDEAEGEEAATLLERLRMPWGPGAAVALLALLLFVSYLVSKSWRRGADSATGKIKLAVLPFKNLSDDPEKEYFSDGMTEEMITELGRMEPEHLGVIARTSVMPYKNSQKDLGRICHDLGVQYVLEGSVFPAGNRARITVQLIQCSDQTHVWADSSEQNLENVLALQTGVAQAIAQKIKLTLTPSKQAQLATARPVNPQAYQDYLKGIYFWEKLTPDATQIAVKYLQTATDEDPSYAPAYARLAECYFDSHAIGLLAYDEAHSRVKAAATKAAALDVDFAEAHIALAHVAEMDWDWPVAEREFRRGIDLDPNLVLAHLSYGHLLMLLRRADESWKEMRTAQVLDPISQVAAQTWLLNLYYSRQYDEAIAFAGQWLELYPDSLGLHEFLAESYAQKGLESLAVKEYLRAEELGGSSSSRMAALQKANRNSGLRGFWQTKLALDRDQASPALSSYDVASDYAALGDRDKSLVWLEKSYTDRKWLLTALSVDPRFDVLRSDPRFQNLLQRLHLPQ